jgi:hypothetical protein
MNSTGVSITGIVALTILIFTYVLANAPANAPVPMSDEQVRARH